MADVVQGISVEKLRELRKYSAFDRRQWILNYARTVGLHAARGYGQTKKLAEMFQVDRKRIYTDFKMIEKDVQPSDMISLQADINNTVYDAMMLGAQQAKDEKLEHKDRVKYARVSVTAAQKLTSMLESFGIKPKDMAPPEEAEAGDLTAVEKLAEEIGETWDLKNLPKVPKVPE